MAALRLFWRVFYSSPIPLVILERGRVLPARQLSTTSSRAAGLSRRCCRVDYYGRHWKGSGSYFGWYERKSRRLLYPCILLPSWQTPSIPNRRRRGDRDMTLNTYGDLSPGPGPRWACVPEGRPGTAARSIPKISFFKTDTLGKQENLGV